MKRILFVFLLVFLFVGAISAQGIVGVGPKVGLNFATIGGDGSSQLSTTTKFLFGGFLDYNIVKDFDLQGELLYNTTGASYTGGNLSASYLEIVTLAKYNIPVDKSVKIFFVAGPQLGIKLSANNHTDANGTDTDISSVVSGTDFDIVIGSGVAFKVGTGSFIADLRYNIGLSNINKSGVASNTNQVFSLAVGYAFSLR
jgi:hypothetical protein